MADETKMKNLDEITIPEGITRIENDNASDFIKYLILNSKEIKDNGSKRYLNYYPQQEKGIQLVIEATKDKKGKLNVDDFMFHHKSKQTWELEVVTPMKTFNKIKQTVDIINKLNSIPIGISIIGIP